VAVTARIAGVAVAERLNEAFPGIVLEADSYSVTVAAQRLLDAAYFLRDDPQLDCKYLNTLLGVDWLDHFDVVYVLSSLHRNHTLVLKARTEHEFPEVPSVTGVWLGAHLQEREVYDLMGIRFGGHPNLKRLFLWEGFPGHPLRKDFLSLPGGYKPGLQRFPFEFPPGQRGYGALSGTDEPAAPEVPRLLPEEALPDTQTRGAGSDPSLAGGAARGPEGSAQRGHAGPGGESGERGRATETQP
jgi:NADH-quinone oxidoreductase subunit C